MFAVDLLSHFLHSKFSSSTIQAHEYVHLCIGVYGSLNKLTNLDNKWISENVPISVYVDQCGGK